MAAQARTILVAYDGTDVAQRALAAAAKVAGYGSTLTVLGVARNGDTGRALLADARERLLRLQMPARYLDSSEPAEEVARDLSADLLVIGRSPGGEQAALLDAAVRGAPCDLLVVT